eukprot:Awhi_evm2s4277
MYADDCLLIAKNSEDMKVMIDCLNENWRKWKFDINSGKSAVLVVSSNKTNESVEKKMLRLLRNGQKVTQRSV